MRIVRPLVAALLVAATAAAQPAPHDAPAPATNSRERFAAATKLFDAGDFAKALDEFRGLVAETGSPNARLYEARCLVALGRLPEAYDELGATVRDAATRAASDPKYLPTRDAAATELAILEPRIARLVVVVTNPPPGTTVAIDGKTIPPEKLGIATSIAPGHLHVEARSPDGRTTSRDIDAGAGQLQTVVLSFGEIAPSPPASSNAPPPPPEPPRGSAFRPAAFVSFGVGAAGLLAFGVAGALARSKYDDVKARCGGTRCTDPSAAGEIDSGKAMQTAANVGVVVAVVAAATGGTFLYLDGRSRRTTVAFDASRTDAALRIIHAF